MARSLVSRLAEEFKVTRMHVRNVIFYNKDKIGATQGENGRWSVASDEGMAALRTLIQGTLPNVATRKRNHGKEATS